MNNSSSQSDPIRKHQRQAAATRRVGKKNHCDCGESRPEALVGNSGVCAACKRRSKGHTTMDNHHAAGKANSPVTVPVPVNHHRAVLSESQYDWPKKTLENPDGCPLRAASACIRGFIDTVVFLIDELLRWIADLLEWLSEFLIDRLGPKWWVKTPLASFTKEK
jgi:hypothetical protein